MTPRNTKNRSAPRRSWGSGPELAESDELLSAMVASMAAIEESTAKVARIAKAIVRVQSELTSG